MRRSRLATQARVQALPSVPRVASHVAFGVGWGVIGRQGRGQEASLTVFSNEG